MFELQNQVTRGFCAWLLIFLSLLTTSRTAQAAGKQTFFEMCSNPQMLSQPQYPPAMLGLGVNMCRDDASYAGVCAKQKGSQDWSTFDAMSQIRATTGGFEWLPIIGYEPKWSQSLPYAVSAQLYGDFVFNVIRRYGGLTHYWESWNEPDLPGHVFFRGGGGDFFAFQKACYLSAKRADPTCHVLFAGLCFASIEGYLKSRNLKPAAVSPAPSSFFEDYLQQCVKDPEAKKNNYYFDIMSQHAYSRASDLYDSAKIDQALMRQYLHEEKPIWFTETGFPDTGGPWGGTPDEFCDYLLQGFAWAKLAGVESVFQFQLDNSNGLGLYSAMLGAPKPALLTYRDLLVKEFGDVRSVKQLHGNAGTGFLQGYSPYSPRPATGYNLFEFFTGDNNRRILMCFADSSADADITVPARSASAILIDRHNKRSPIVAQSGAYHIHLLGSRSMAGWPITGDPRAKGFGKPEHLVGGPTVTILENGL